MKFPPQGQYSDHGNPESPLSFRACQPDDRGFDRRGWFPPKAPQK